MAKTPVFGSGSGVPNQKLRVYCICTLSGFYHMAKQHSRVKRSAPRLLMSRNFGMSVNTAEVAMTYFKHNDTSKVG